MSRLPRWRWIGAVFVPLLVASSCAEHPKPANPSSGATVHSFERQVTFAPSGHVLTNANVWSPDGNFIAYDVRTDAAGSRFDGDRIEAVDVRSGEVRLLYVSQRGAKCGVVSWDPTLPRVAFILGPEDPTADYNYGPTRRRGVTVALDGPGVLAPLDARDLTPPFTPGALRGGSHVHVFSPDGKRVSFTYEDDVLSGFRSPTLDHDVNQRNVAVAFERHVAVPKTNLRNEDGNYFSVVVTRTTAFPHAGSDEISRAYEEAWVGNEGYLRPDGSRQRWAIAFQGDVATVDGEKVTEVFIVDDPEDLTQPGEGPLQGTATRRPYPPRGTTQRRLTITANRRFPGVQGPRHWLRSSPDGSQIACLMKDDAGVAQLWTVSPLGGAPRQVTHNPTPIASAFTWSPDGRSITHLMDNSVCVTDVESGRTTRLTIRAEDAAAPRPEACVFSPDGRSIAYVAPVFDGSIAYNQVFVTTVPAGR